MTLTCKSSNLSNSFWHNISATKNQFSIKYNRNLIHHSRANGPPSPLTGKARHTFGVRKKRSILLTPAKKGLIHSALLSYYFFRFTVTTTVAPTDTTITAMQTITTPV